MAKRSNPIATFFDYTWKYIWPALIEIGIIGLGFLFVYFRLHYKMSDWLNSTISWIGRWFDGINKYCWAIELGEWAIGFGEGSFFVEVLLFIPRIAALLVGFAVTLVIQGVVNVLAAIAGFVIIVVLGILYYVICFGVIYVFPAASVLFAFGMAFYLRKSQGVELPVMEGILWVLLDMILPIVYLVLYYIYLPI